ncbi:hypothetical protein, partial [Streptomyces sp. NPDC058583]|uniref:hypothetical protein n=1 Tax=Streptomyces sp. NPDC058583 TaxID=3346549 RepID=UPI00364BBE48
MWIPFGSEGQVLLADSAVRVLKPLARTLALGLPEPASLGGVVLAPLLQKLFLPEHATSVAPVVYRWLQEGGIRVLTEEETLAGMTLAVARKNDGLGREPRADAIIQELIPGTVLPVPTGLQFMFTGYLEAVGYGMRTGLTFQQMAVSIAIQRATERGGRYASTSRVIAEVLRAQPQNPNWAQRIQSWNTMSRYLDSLGTPSPYTRYAATVVERAGTLRDNGTIDIAKVAAEFFPTSQGGYAVPGAWQRAAVRFWLEEARLTGLVGADEPERRAEDGTAPHHGVAAAILALIGDYTPSLPGRLDGAAWRRRADFAISLAAVKLARKENVTVQSVANDAFDKFPADAREVVLTGAFLEIGGLGGLDRRPPDDSFQEYMTAAFREARAQLRDGRRAVDSGDVLTALGLPADRETSLKVLEAWFTVVGLVGGPLDPNSLVGRLQAAAREFAARERAAHRVPQVRDAARHVFGEAEPSSIQTAVVAEWLDEDPVRLYAVGLARRDLRSQGTINVPAIAIKVLGSWSAKDRNQQVTDWLADEGLPHWGAFRVEPPSQAQGDATTSDGETTLGANRRYLASHVETMVYDGASLGVLAQKVTPFLSPQVLSDMALSPTGVQEYAHRLLLEHAPVYRGHFEEALSGIIARDRTTTHGVTPGLLSYAAERGLHVSVVEQWSRHYREVETLRNAFEYVHPVHRNELLLMASGYLNARIGGLMLEARSATQKLLRDERVLLVAGKLLHGDTQGALFEVERIARELNVPAWTQGRLVGGSGRSEEYHDFLRAVAESEAAWDSTHAESSTMAAAWAKEEAAAVSATPPTAHTDAAVEPDPALRAYMEQTEDGVWAENVAEEWLIQRGRTVLDPDTETLTPDAVAQLRPLALALAQDEEALLGGVDTRELGERLFTPETLPWAWASLEEWLAEEGIRAFTETERPIAKLLVLVRHQDPDEAPIHPDAIAGQLLPELAPKRARQQTMGYLEVLANQRWLGLRPSEIMVALAAMMAPKHGGLPVNLNDIVRDVLDADPGWDSHIRRLEAWRDATLLLDSLEGSQSPYSRFVGETVEFARTRASVDGTIDIAKVAASVFAPRHSDHDHEPTPEQRAAVKFWLEQARLSGLTDSLEGAQPQPVRIFPPRNGLAQAVMKIVGQDTPAPQSWGEQLSAGRRVDLVVWKAAELAAQGEWFTMQDLWRQTFDGAQRMSYEIPAYLEATGLEALAQRRSPATAYMALAFQNARERLKGGSPISVHALVKTLHSEGEVYLERPLTAWLRAVGLLDGPLDPGGVVGRIRGAVRELAAANPYMSVEDLVRRVFKEPSPLPSQIAVVTEWLAEDPQKVYALGLARKALAENEKVSASYIAERVFGSKVAEQDGLRKVSDWLVEAAYRTVALEEGDAVETDGGVPMDTSEHAREDEGGDAGVDPSVLSDLAEVAEGVAFAGVAWPVLAVELSPLLP